MPLVVPEVNGRPANHNGVIANPNCCAPSSPPRCGLSISPAGIRKIVVSTYQSASGAGAAAMRELEDQVHQYADGSSDASGLPASDRRCNLFSRHQRGREGGRPRGGWGGRAPFMIRFSPQGEGILTSNASCDSPSSPWVGGGNCEKAGGRFKSSPSPRSMSARLVWPATWPAPRRSRPPCRRARPARRSPARARWRRSAGP